MYDSVIQTDTYIGLLNVNIWYNVFQNEVTAVSVPTTLVKGVQPY